MTGWAANIRSYGAELPFEQHDFVQLVLPLSGAIELDIGGKSRVIGSGFGAAVPSNVSHTQQNIVRHQALILDIDKQLARDCGVDTLFERRYFERSTSSQQLTKMLARTITQSNVSAAPQNTLLAICAPTFLPPSDKLLALEELVMLAPYQPMSVADMSLACGLSDSQFHEVFRRHFGVTPHQWLLSHRLNRVRDELEESDISLSSLAQRSGYSDQSALTRAFRNHFGMPLSEYRRNSRH
jgi:AraC-like DNA-binding protein